jgi:hypothetical protein
VQGQPQQQDRGMGGVAVSLSLSLVLRLGWLRILRLTTLSSCVLRFDRPDSGSERVLDVFVAAASPLVRLCLTSNPAGVNLASVQSSLACSVQILMTFHDEYRRDRWNGESEKDMACHDNREGGQENTKPNAEVVGSKAGGEPKSEAAREAASVEVQNGDQKRRKR